MPYRRDSEVPEPREQQMLVLSRLGWKIRDIAVACDVSAMTVQRGLKKWDEYYLELPALNISQKRMEAMIPQAITVFERNLNSKRAEIAFKAAVVVLTNFGVLTEGKSLLDDTDQQHSGRLVKEARAILASAESRRTGPADKNNDNASPPQDGGTSLGLDPDTSD